MHPFELWASYLGRGNQGQPQPRSQDNGVHLFDEFEMEARVAAREIWWGVSASHITTVPSLPSPSIKSASRRMWIHRATADFDHGYGIVTCLSC